jgi:hypothetical protein
MNINFDVFKETLPIMAKGMIGIFAVTAIIILVILLLNKFTTTKK